MGDKVQAAWDEFLNPDVLRPRLISASIYIAAFELLKDAIVERLRGFYGGAFDENGEIVGPEYQSKVLARNRSPVHASLAWLQESHAIEREDIEAFERVKDLRNRFAHGLLDILGAGGLPAEFEARFGEMISLLHKIELWWIVEVDIPTNSDFDGQEVDYERIVPGSVVQLQLLCGIALGNDEESRYYHQEFRRRCEGGDA